MGSKPKAPDPYKQAEAQRAENTWTSQYNTIGSNANQITPYGNVTNAPGTKIPIYDSKGNITGYGTQWSQTTTLSPAQQAIFDQENAAKLGFGQLANQQLGQAKNILGQPINTEGMVNWQQYEKAPGLAQANYQGTDRQAIEDAMMASTRRGLEPTYRQQDAQLAARGVGAPGSKMGSNVDVSRGDTLAEAGRQAYLTSGEESRQQAGEARNVSEAANKVTQQGWLNKNTWADQANALRQSQWGERTGLRNQILNELSVLAGNAPATVPQAQGFQGSQVNPFDIAGALQTKYGQDMANYQNQQSGLFGIAKSVLGMIPFGNMFSGAFGKGGSGGLY